MLDTGTNLVAIALGIMIWCFIGLFLIAWLDTAGVAIVLGVPAMAVAGYFIQEKGKRRKSGAR